MTWPIGRCRHASSSASSSAAARLTWVLETWTERFVSLRRIFYAAFSVILAIVGYWLLRHGVVEPIALFFFNYDIS